MRLRHWFIALTMVVTSHSAWAQDMDAIQIVERAAMRLFPNMPIVLRTFDHEACGIGEGVNARLAYCTSRDAILLREAQVSIEKQAYELAHLYGHAVQVKHGVADVALREISKRREEEAKLRGWVTRQVECIAGVIHAETGLPAISLLELYDEEPLTQSHWGRDPLTRGPKVSVGLEARAKWFAIGRQGDISKCAVGEFGSELLVKALR